MTSEESSGIIDSLLDVAEMCRKAAVAAEMSAHFLRQHVAQMEDRVLQLERELTLASLPPPPE